MAQLVDLTRGLSLFQWSVTPPGNFGSLAEFGCGDPKCVQLQAAASFLAASQVPSAEHLDEHKGATGLEGPRLCGGSPGPSALVTSRTVAVSHPFVNFCLLRRPRRPPTFRYRYGSASAPPYDISECRPPARAVVTLELIRGRVCEGAFQQVVTRIATAGRPRPCCPSCPEIALDFRDPRGNTRSQDGIAA